MIEHRDVVIVGGGPVGLAAAYLLGREGVRVELVEKREATAVQPKGQGMNAASMELFAQWGVRDLILPGTWPFDRSNGQALYDTLRGGEVAGFARAEGGVSQNEAFYGEISPEVPRSVPAYVYEAALRDRASTWPGVSLSFATEAVDLDLRDDGVSLTVKAGASGERREIRAKYLIAADGGASWTRGKLQAEEVVGPDFSQQLVTEFKGDLGKYWKGAQYFHIFIGKPEYAGWFGAQQSPAGNWRYNFANPQGRQYSAAEIIERIRGAIGDPDFQLEIVKSTSYRYTTALTRQWRHGRVFLVGDSAHRHSVWGGFGGNTGLQEANNLSWKLAAVLRNAAPDALLDTYEEERKPRAVYTVKLATYNAYHYQMVIDVDQFLRDDRAPGGGGGDFVREFWRGLLGTMQRATGIEFGAVYRSRAVVPDGSVPPVSQAGHFAESSSPGVRAPHVWLTDAAGRRKALFDHWNGHFALVVNGAGKEWDEQAQRLQQELGTPIDVHHIGVQGGDLPADGKWDRIYALQPGGAVLVRPDGFIGAKFAQRPGDVGQALTAALRTVLGFFE